MRGGIADMAHQSTRHAQGSRNARTRVFARISCPAMKKDAVCQVFISPGRPGKTHFRAAMRRSSDLGEPLRTVAAPRGAVPGCSTWVQGYLGAGVPGCRGTWVHTWVQHLSAGVPGCSTRVQYLGAVPGVALPVRGGWPPHQGAAPGCSTWVQYLGAAPGCRGTWVEHLGAVPGCSTRVLHLGAVPGCSTAPGCSTWGGAARKGWVAPAPREGCRTPPGVPPLVAHLCQTATIIIWKAHPVRGGAPREGWRTP